MTQESQVKSKCPLIHNGQGMGGPLPVRLLFAAPGFLRGASHDVCARWFFEREAVRFFEKWDRTCEIMWPWQWGTPRTVEFSHISWRSSWNILMLWSIARWILLDAPHGDTVKDPKTALTHRRSFGFASACCTTSISGATLVAQIRRKPFRRNGEL